MRIRLQEGELAELIRRSSRDRPVMALLGSGDLDVPEDDWTIAALREIRTTER